MSIVCVNLTAFYFLIPGVYTKYWFVSNVGTLDNSCGASMQMPCKDLLEVIHKAGDSDVIYINAQGTDKEPLNVCSSHYISKSVSIIGHNGRPHIGCDEQSSNYILKFTSRSKDTHSRFNHSQTNTYYIDAMKIKSVQLNNLHLTSGLILACDISLVISETVFEDASIIFTAVSNESHQNRFKYDLEACNFINTTFYNVTMLNAYTSINSFFEHNFISYSDINVFCSFIDIRLVQMNIYGRRLRILESLSGGLVEIDNVKFIGNSSFDTFGGITIENDEGLNSTLGEPYQLNIYDSSFTNLSNNDIFMSVLYHHLQFNKAPIYINISGDIDVLIENTTFMRNERALVIDVREGSVIIKMCNFSNNTSAFHAGVIMIKHSHTGLLNISITHCLFTYNEAGYRPQYVMSKYNRSINITTDEKDKLRLFNIQYTRIYDWVSGRIEENFEVEESLRTASPHATVHVNVSEYDDHLTGSVVFSILIISYQELNLEFTNAGFSKTLQDTVQVVLFIRCKNLWF